MNVHDRSAYARTHLASSRSRVTLVITVLGACCPPTPTSEPVRATDNRTAPATSARSSDVPVDAASLAPSGHAHLLAVRNRLVLIAISADGERALLAILQPIARAPELRVVDIATNKTTARVELHALAALPRRPFFDDDPAHDAELAAAISENRRLHEELVEAAALLAGFGGLHGADFAASADGRHFAYTVDEGELHLAHRFEPGGQRLKGGDDPWTALDGTTLLFKDGDPHKDTSTLWAVPFAGGIPRRIAGTDHVTYHSDPIARPDGTLRVLAEHRRRRCVVDVDVAKLRVARTICLPRATGIRNDAIVMSPGGDRIAWIDSDWDGKRSWLSAMDLATRRLFLDTSAVDFSPAVDGKHLLVGDRGRVYVSVGASGYVIEENGTARRVVHDPALRDCRLRNER